MAESDFSPIQNPFPGESEASPLPSSLNNFFRQNYLVLFFALLGLGFLAAGMFSMFSGSQKKEEIIFEEGVQEEKLKADIGGAVVKPGVYELASGARIQDALILAEGLSSLADREWVAKNLNLAAKLTDGAKIYIPQKNELGIRNPPAGEAGQVSGTSGEISGRKISINSASAEELDRLPGVGPVTAQKIISSRPYQSLEDVLNKKIVSASTFSKIKDQLTLW